MQYLVIVSHEITASSFELYHKIRLNEDTPFFFLFIFEDELETILLFFAGQFLINAYESDVIEDF